MASDVLLVESPSDLDGVEFRGSVAVDTETTGLKKTDRLMTVQVHEQVTTVVLDARKMSPIYLLRRLQGKRWILQNGKFDIGVLMPWIDELTSGQPWLAWSGLWDTFLAEAVLVNGHEDLRCDLGSIALRHLRVKMDKSEQLMFVRGKEEEEAVWEARIAQPFTQSMLDYMVNDVKVLHPIMLSQRARLANAGLQQVADLEFELMPCLADMERNGMRIDVEATAALLQELRGEEESFEKALVDRLTPHILEWRANRHQTREEAIQRFDAWAAEVKAKLEEEAAAREYPSQKARREAINAAMKEWREAHKRPSRVKMDEGPINIRSNQQLPAALAAMGLELKNAQADTLEIVAASLEDGEAQSIINDLLEFRKLSKLTGTTLEPMLDLHDDEFRVHTQFRQIVRTGRMASAAPNLQNIPARGERGKKIRGLFVSQPGWAFIGADYSQIELRVLAEDIYKKTGDRTMLDIFLEGKLDLHSKTAAEMYEVPYEDVHPDDGPKHGLRREAKTISFGHWAELKPTQNGETPLGQYRARITSECIDLQRVAA